MRVSLPDEAGYIISALEKGGFEAYAVGGCVRDSLMGNEPGDWDICTSALPEQTMETFSGHRVIETGLKHGTVTLMLNGKPFEITTFRSDGVYSDNRRPDNVEFVGSLDADLSRRDFTVNAMAYNPRRGVVDLFDGTGDLRGKTIRCVGSADMRFKEDALRIMRALRFASVLGFVLEPDTAAAALGNMNLLKNIAPERIAGELNRLISGANAGAVLREYTPVVCVIIPEIKKMVGFRQNNPYHYLDVWEHTLACVDAAPVDVVLRLAMLFHDIGKPSRYTEKNGIGHFYGHPEVSAQMAKIILKRLRYDTASTTAVTRLIAVHDADIRPSDKSVKRWLNKIGENGLRSLLAVKKADTMGKNPKFRHEKLRETGNVELALDRIISQRQCFTLDNLAVNGNDIMDIGVPEGAAVGAVLNALLDLVIDGGARNNREELLVTAEKLAWKQKGK